MSRNFAGSYDTKALAAGVSLEIAISIPLTGKTAWLCAFARFKTSVAVLVDTYRAFGTFRRQLLIGAEAGINASVAVGVFSLLKGRANDVFAALGIIISRQARSLETLVFQCAFITIIAGTPVRHVLVAAGAFRAGVEGALVAVIACFVRAAFAFTGICSEIACSFLTAVQITGALDTDEVFRAFTTGTL